MSKREQIVQLKQEASEWRALAQNIDGAEYDGAKWLCFDGPNQDRLSLFRPDDVPGAGMWWKCSCPCGSGPDVPSEGRVLACLFLAEMCDDEIRELRSARE